MPKISKLLTGDEKSLHLFSNDLVWGCRYHAMQASQSQHTYSTFTANLSCVLFAGSFLEAKLNERSTRPAVAPSAMRIPTSRVRRAVSYETSAYVPISTSANARPEKHESRKLRNRTRAVDSDNVSSPMLSLPTIISPGTIASAASRTALLSADGFPNVRMSANRYSQYPDSIRLVALFSRI
jgi:hypothetical protein